MRGIDNRSDEARAYRAMYRTREWYKIRKAALVRDMFKCTRCGVAVLTGRENRLDRRFANVHHVHAHKGDSTLFYDLSNVTTVCHGCHSGAIQQIERSGYDTTIGDDGWPLDMNHPANRK